MAGRQAEATFEQHQRGLPAALGRIAEGRLQVQRLPGRAAFDARRIQRAANRLAVGTDYL